jgi:GC-rich sequence DNA-binding factor
LFCFLTECNIFKVKKSSYSRRLAKQSEKSKKRSDNKNKEIKNEKNFDKNDNKTNDELNVIWIKSEEINNKQETKEDIKILTGDEINEDLYEEEDEYKSNEPFHHFRGALERGVIPDAKTIYALKKQRQMARDVDEFIPLDDDEKYEDNRDSRIVRDDDNDKSDDDDEDNERISFAINKDNIEREKAREAFLFAQEEEDDDRKEESEDELERWEREQIKKGVRMPSIQLISQEQASNLAISGQFSRQTLFSDNLTVVNMDIDKPIETKKSSSIPSSILAKSKSNVSSEDVSERIRNKLLKIKESLEYHERQIVNLTADMNVSKEVIDSCSDKSPKLATQFELYQNISTYISGLFGCLNDKVNTNNI